MRFTDEQKARIDRIVEDRVQRERRIHQRDSQAMRQRIAELEAALVAARTQPEPSRRSPWWQRWLYAI